MFPSELPAGEFRCYGLILRRFLPASECIKNATVKVPVPPVLQAEAGDARPRLLKWLAKHKGIQPDESAPVLRFPDRFYVPERDFLYLNSPVEVQTLSGFLIPENSMLKTNFFRRRIRQIALPASIRHSEHLPLLLERLGTLAGLRELAFAFVELDHAGGELQVVDPVPRKHPAAYTLEPLGDGDIADYRRKLCGSIRGLEALIRPMLRHYAARDIKITACKMIPRC